jgi:ATP-binding cassette subfamily B protein
LAAACIFDEEDFPSACRVDRRLPGGCAFGLGMRMTSDAVGDGCREPGEEEDTAMRTGRFEDLLRTRRTVESGGAGTGAGLRDAKTEPAPRRLAVAEEVTYRASSLRAAKRGHLSLLARVRREAARDRPQLVVFACTALMHALGHAALALAAGMCAWSLVHGTEATRVADLPRLPLLTTQPSASWWAALGLIAAAAKLLGGSAASYVQGRVSGDLAASLRVELLDVWLGSHRSHGMARSRQGDHTVQDRAGAPTEALAAITAEVREVQAGLDRGLLGGVRAGLQLVPLLALFAELAPQAALGAALILAPLAVVLGALRRRWARGHRRAAGEAARLLEAADDAVRHADLWTTFGAQGKARAQVAALGSALAMRAARLEAAAAAMSGVNELLAALLLLAIFAAQAHGLIAVPSASLVPLLVAFFLAYRPVRELAEARLSWTRAEAAYDALPFGQDAEIAPAQPVVGEPKGWPLAELEIDALTIAGSGIAPLSLRVAPGEIVAIAGRTGAGKTSFLRALLGLEPVTGTVRYDGVTLTEAAVGPASRPFTWVPQEAPMLSGSLADNVNLGAAQPPGLASTAPDRLTDSLADTLTLIGAGHLVAALGEARLGAGGRALSGGERQWVALARAVATAQPVLLLDEPTSGLDARSQEEVLRAITRLRGARTVLLVTHRPEPLKIADRVVHVGD